MSTIYDRIKARRQELGLTAEELAQELGYKDKSSISKIENGRADIPQAKVERFAEALHTTTAYLMGVDDPAARPEKPLTRVPIVGRVACGCPILAEQNIEGEIAVPENWHADFVLTCHGDSMAPRILDGDLVAVRSQPEVEDGEIAVVRIGDEATLKKVYWSGETLVLLPLNTTYPLMTYRGPTLADVHIEGKAVGLCRDL